MKNATQYIYGRNAVLEALTAKRVLEVFVARTFSDKSILQALDQQAIPIIRKEIEWLSSTVKGNHQGIIARIKEYEYTNLEQLIELDNGKQYPLLLMLDSIVDPHNLGAIIRNGEAFGASGIIIRKDRAVGLTSAVAKVASGALEHMHICQVINLSQAIMSLKDNGYWVVSSALDRAIDYRDFDYKRKIVLIIGAEGSGISPLVQKNSDVIVKIPMLGQVNSINASAAAAVLLAHIQASRFPR